MRGPDTMPMERRIAEILINAGRPASPIRPTELYNETWMLRLLLDWCASQAPPTHHLYFHPGARWSSEALLRSAFGPTFRGDLSQNPGPMLTESSGTSRLGSQVVEILCSLPMRRSSWSLRLNSTVRCPPVQRTPRPLIR